MVLFVPTRCRSCSCAFLPRNVVTFLCYVFCVVGQASFSTLGPGSGGKQQLSRWSLRNLFLTGSVSLPFSRFCSANRTVRIKFLFPPSLRVLFLSSVSQRALQPFCAKTWFLQLSGYGMDADGVCFPTPAFPFA